MAAMVSSTRIAAAALCAFVDPFAGRREDCRTARERRTEEESGNIEPLFEPPIEDRERLLVVETALHRLPSEQREVLVLKIWGQLTFE
jgi:RNA polymerase sigma-70 factor (ECF subfamily)